MQKIKSNNQLYIFIFIILIIAGCLFYYFLNSKNNDNFAITEIKKEEILEKYTNTQLGFSIDIPKEISGVYKCSPFKNFMVPVKVFEDDKNGVTYIAPEYYYEARQINSSPEYGPCQKIYYSTDMLREETFKDDLGWKNLNIKIYKPVMGWAIIVKTVKNEEELGAVIKNMFGKGCDYKKKDWKQSGIYEISFGEKNSEGLNLGNTTCPTNYSYKLFYIPSHARIIFIKNGQDCNFVNAQKNKCYDNKMIDSFLPFYNKIGI